MTQKVAVIGSGIGGIATAIRLQNKGFEVTLFESNSYPGGKLSEINSGDYRFDAGPSLFTMPQYVEELFKICNKNPEDHFSYIKLPIICNYFWEDGTRLQANADTTIFAKEIEAKLNVKAEIVEKYLAQSEKNYDILGGLFVEQSLHKWNTWISSKALKGYLNIFNLGLFSTLHQKNEQTFRNPKLIQLFNRYATYNGSDPYQTPATMSIIPHLEYNIGAFFPKKGMNSITSSLVELAKSIGVSIMLHTPVSEIIVENGKAKGVRLKKDSTFIPFDMVVSNMDVSPTYRKLLANEKAPEKTLSQARSGSGLIFYWGIKKQFKDLDLHNILFSDNYKEEFNWQFTKKDIYNDPTVYINISSKQKADDAPQGCENWFVLINAPANEGQNWDEIIERTRKNIFAKVERILGVNIKELIETEEVLDPRSIELKTSSAQGALYGTSSNNKFAAFFRHANFSSKIKNLYFVGGSVHPGGGIPLALSSAKIVSAMIENKK